MDLVLNKLPVLGKLYLSLKQILGYGSGQDALFKETVLISGKAGMGEEIGLVTNTFIHTDGTCKYIVFVPGSPNPTAGRLVIADREQIRFIQASANEALKLLVAIGTGKLNTEELEGRSS